MFIHLLIEECVFADGCVFTVLPSFLIDESIISGLDDHDSLPFATLKRLEFKWHRKKNRNPFMCVNAFL